MNNITITTDPGIDDLVALMLLLKLKPQNKNALISTFGNGEETITSRNAKEFIAFAAPNWQFKNGPSLPFNGKIEHPWPDYFHGPDGVWNIHPKVDISDVRSLSKYPNNNELISLGTLTEPYKIIKEFQIENITIMGGAFNIKGNETPYAETNIAFDPDAAHLFFSLITNQQVQVVPLDVTRKVLWKIEKVQSIPEINEQNRWIKKMLLTWFDKYDHNREKDFNLHDPLAVYLKFFPEKAIWQNNGVDVITSGIKRGKTIINNNNAYCSIALNIYNGEEIANDIFSIIFGE